MLRNCVGQALYFDYKCALLSEFRGFYLKDAICDVNKDSLVRQFYIAGVSRFATPDLIRGLQDRLHNSCINILLRLSLGNFIKKLQFVRLIQFP